MVRSWRYPSSGLRAALGVLAAALIALPLAVPLQATPAEALPAGLPTHFGFGLGAGQGDSWMPQSGIHWDYRYQYLTGGVNTGAGWETWNSSGTFASNYATESAQNGYIPVYPYYELLQSSGSCNSCGEGQRDLSNLNNASVMNAYYQNFALLMKRLGPGSYDGVQGFGRTSVVDVEADFSGGYAIQAVNNTGGACFGFCTGQGNDPSLLKASVGSSGFADVAGYPNTLTGFTQALAHLRDLYAPRSVLLGYHLSPWATGIDIGTDTNPSTNATALGQQAGTFLDKLGAHDVIFNDPLDRDAGLYKTQLGQNRWWDRNNVSLPNFTRWEQFLHGATVADANRPILLWQIPVGNQYFDTLNNTNGHFQDNRAEYIFGHIPELINAGVIGAMFGAGNGSSTTFTDATGDGITNPASFCTTDGISSGQICNNHVSTVSDDDGGYIRMQGKAYYTNPVPLSGGSSPTSTPTPGSTSTPTVGSTPTRTPTPSGQLTFSSKAGVTPTSVALGTTASIVATVANPPVSTALIDVEVYDASFTRVALQAWDNQQFTAGQPRSFTLAWPVPTTATTGGYTVMVGVFSPGWGTLENWNGSAGTFSVTAAGAATPTRAATSTPTSTPLATRTPTPTQGTAQRGFTMGASESPSTVTRGQGVSFTVSVKSNTALATLVDVEVYNAAGARVFLQAWDNQAFSAGQTRTFSTAWSVPSGTTTGAYTVMVGVFSPGWTTFYAWNGNAATLTVN